jgi:hypothetical protein
MAMAEHPRQRRGRNTTSSCLRLLAAFVALLLTASALGQAAHFLLVPHTICAEHGELLDLADQASHTAAAQPQAVESARETRAAQPEAAFEHDHCQVLARGQREQALPKPAAVAVLPPAAVESSVALEVDRTLVGSLPTLQLAPKTSPPRALGC